MKIEQKKDVFISTINQCILLINNILQRIDMKYYTFQLHSALPTKNQCSYRHAMC
jgi:hypothetical protein